jgi:hypothetical protein
MIGDTYWALDHLGERSVPAGYLRSDDLPDTGSFASELVSALKSGRPGASIDVWVQAVSESVPRRSVRTPYSQFLALREARTTLKNMGRSRASGPFVHTMFGKTLTSFAVKDVGGPTDRHHHRMPDELAPYTFGPLGRCRLDPAMSSLEAARQLMRVGWIASVASSMTRRHGANSWGAESTVATALSSAVPVDDDAMHDLLKAFTTPPWRSDPSDLLSDQRALAHQGNDLHFPELLREHEMYAEFAPRGRQEQYLLATDVHGLFRGSTRRWVGLANLLLPVATQFRSGEIAFDEFIDEAYRIRLSVTSRLRRTLQSIVAIDGLDRSIFGRGDGIFAFVRTIASVVPDLERLAKETKLLPFGVGIVQVTTEMSLRDALARAEAALCITKLAEAGSTERLHYMYGDALSPPTQRRLDIALQMAAPKVGRANATAKELDAIRSYHRLLVPLLQYQ